MSRNLPQGVRWDLMKPRTRIGLLLMPVGGAFVLGLTYLATHFVILGDDHFSGDSRLYLPALPFFLLVLIGYWLADEAARGRVTWVGLIGIVLVIVISFHLLTNPHTLRRNDMGEILFNVPQPADTISYFIGYGLSVVLLGLAVWGKSRSDSASVE